jgi:zinc finger protein
MAIDNLFPRIGEVVETADKIQTTDNEQDEKVVQEIESLCMKCEEQVRIT